MRLSMAKLLLSFNVGFFSETMSVRVTNHLLLFHFFLFSPDTMCMSIVMCLTFSHAVQMNHRLVD